eukprot:Em0005g824a
MEQRHLSASVLTLRPPLGVPMPLMLLWSADRVWLMEMYVCLANGGLLKSSVTCTSSKCSTSGYTSCSGAAVNSYGGVVCSSSDNATDSVRLSGGSRASTGRVEVLYNGVWGTVCNKTWTIAEARAVCNLLGYGIDTVSIKSLSFSGLSSLSPIWISGLTCSSSVVTNITQCGYTKPLGYGPFCTHTYDALVDCGGKLRAAAHHCLTITAHVQPSPRAHQAPPEWFPSPARQSHRGDVSEQDVGYTVCGDSSNTLRTPRCFVNAWDSAEHSIPWTRTPLRDATAQLGIFGFQLGVTRTRSCYQEASTCSKIDASYHNITLFINYKAVSCNGTETSLSQCSHSETITGCTHASDAAMVCRQNHMYLPWNLSLLEILYCLLSAKIYWALTLGVKHYSFKCSFTKTFPDSSITSKFACGEKKCSYLTTFVFAPCVQQLLASKLKSVGSYVLLFDESLTNHMEMKQPDLHIRVWEDEKVATHYFTSRLLGHATAEQLLEELQAWCIEVGNKVNIGFVSEKLVHERNGKKRISDKDVFSVKSDTKTFCMFLKPPISCMGNKKIFVSMDTCEAYLSDMLASKLTKETHNSCSYFSSRAAQSPCSSGATRVVPFTSSPVTYAGIVEVCLKGTWGTVCADSPDTLWSEKNAQVFCQGLGFSGALNPVDQST